MRKVADRVKTQAFRKKGQQFVALATARHQVGRDHQVGIQAEGRHSEGRENWQRQTIPAYRRAIGRQMVGIEAIG
jgi:hypothetical protein